MAGSPVFRGRRRARACLWAGLWAGEGGLQAVTRLSNATLGNLPEGVAIPRYDRGAVAAGVVHLGIGAFHRAHQAVVFEQALNAGDLRWGITGASLRSAAVRDEMAPQDGLYTVVTRDGADERITVVGAVREVLVAPEDPAGLVARLAHPETHLVTLTVTEKGYKLDPATGTLLADDPDVIADRADPARPRTAPGFLVAALQARRRTGLAPFTAISCDNLPHNGRAAASRGCSPSPARPIRRWRTGSRGTAPFRRRWSTGSCRPPARRHRRAGSVAGRRRPGDGEDRAVPAMGDRGSVLRAARRISKRRAYRSPRRLPPGRKPSSACSTARIRGSPIWADWPASSSCTKSWRSRPLRASSRHLWDEAEATLSPPPGLDVAAYRRALMARFADPALQHRTRQIAMDGSQKLPQRLLAPIAARRERGLGVEMLALAVAAWMRWQGGRDDAGAASRRRRSARGGDRRAAGAVSEIPMRRSRPCCRSMRSSRPRSRTMMFSGRCSVATSVHWPSMVRGRPSRAMRHDRKSGGRSRLCRRRQSRAAAGAAHPGPARRARRSGRAAAMTICRCSTRCVAHRRPVSSSR